jgi:dihydroneopterin aldolase
MKTTVTLESVKFHAFHGVAQEERITGCVFLTDISYTVDTNAVDTDDINDTINYADLYKLIEEEMMKPSQLIEHVAGRILKALKSSYPQMREITVKVSKLHPPVCGEVEKATVTVKI